MMVENVMYFALGLLAASLVAMMIMPAIWKRAVRLTKKRIEAATPMTMAEFRADKDQLRAEFALSTRRLEMSVEALRNRLAEQLREINRKKGDLTAVKSDRDNHLTIIRELEEREGELRRRVLELEKESADVSQRLRMRDREYADKVAQVDALRESVQQSAAPDIEFDGQPLTGDYSADVVRLIQVVEIERKRVGFLETQNAELLTRLEVLDQQATEAAAATDELRRALARREDAGADKGTELLLAEGRIADAEGRLNALLVETSRIVAEGEARADEMLAEKLAAEDELADLRGKVESVESTVMADWDSDRIEQTHLRERLNDIAADVARLVYAVEGRDPLDNDVSLLERVQRFSDEGIRLDEFPVRTALQQKQGIVPPNATGKGSMADRLAAIRDIQNRN